MQFLFPKPSMPRPDQVLPGRSEAIIPSRPHFVNGRSITPPYPEGFEVADFGMGCFWGAEKDFWSAPGRVGDGRRLPGRHDANPTYQESCTGQTGHAEVVRVVYDPSAVSYEQLLQIFWESHDPTQGFRQGNDVGTEYRSAIFTHSAAPAGHGDGVARHVRGGADEGRATARSRPRSARRRSSTSPRTTTSSTSRRTRTATARTTRPA